MKIAILSLILATIIPSHAVAADDEYYTDRIAGVLIGEGGELGDDYDTLACTVRNRLEKGWRLGNVLNHYNAAYVKPTQAHIDALRLVLDADAENLTEVCRSVYFFYAEWYALRWIDPQVVPVAKMSGNWFYRYEDYRRF